MSKKHTKCCPKCSKCIDSLQKQLNTQESLIQNLLKQMNSLQSSVNVSSHETTKPSPKDWQGNTSDNKRILEYMVPKRSLVSHHTPIEDETTDAKDETISKSKRSVESLKEERKKTSLSPQKPKEYLSSQKSKESFSPCKLKESLSPRKSKESLSPKKSKQSLSPQKSKESISVLKVKEPKRKSPEKCRNSTENFREKLNQTSKEKKQRIKKLKKEEKGKKEDFVRIIKCECEDNKHCLFDRNYEVQLKIGMLSNKILKGTEKNIECECGSEKCIERFLPNNIRFRYFDIMRDQHSFIDRNYLLYYACVNPEMTVEDCDIIDRYCLFTGLMGSNSPMWLQKWASLILRYFEYENELIKIELEKEKEDFSLNDIYRESNIIMHSRISHLALALDKVKHSLLSMKIEEPPLFSLSYRDIFVNFCEHKTSFRLSLFNILEKLENSEFKEQCLEEFWKAADISISPEMADIECKEQFIKVLNIISEISIKLRQIKSKKINIEALADFLYLYSKTYTYFTPNQAYKKFKCYEVCIKKCDILNNNSRKKKRRLSSSFIQEDKTIIKKQEFDSGYVWGQLCCWFRPSIERPNSLMSSERKLSLNYPDLDSFEIKKNSSKTRSSKMKYFEESLSLIKERENKNDLNTNDYNKNNLTSNSNSFSNTTLDCIKAQDIPTCEYYTKEISSREEFLDMWNKIFCFNFDPTCSWSFKSKFKMYGSVQFESLILSNLKFGQDRLEYFHKIMNDLLSFKTKI